MHKALLAGLVAGCCASAAQAVSVRDPAGDMLPTFVGPAGGDLDVLTARVAFDGTNFLLSSTQNGQVGTTAGGFYVWGIDRGAGTAGFVAGSPSIGAGVLFDAVAILRLDGSLTVISFGAPPTVIPGGTTILGNAISAVVPLALLPSTGFAPAQYGFNLWPRSAGAGNSFVADFAPDGSTFTASVPEPASWALLIAGFAVVGAAMRRRARPQFIAR